MHRSMAFGRLPLAFRSWRRLFQLREIGRPRLSALSDEAFSFKQPYHLFSSSGDCSNEFELAEESQRQKGFFPRRAVMYVPASDERKTKKATTLNVDTLVFDLEDGVAVNQKVTNLCV